MPEIQSCGFLIYRNSPERSFLLMQHPERWDLPKGHVDNGETEMQCALRELNEETGIAADQIVIDDEFRYEQHYMVTLPRYNHVPRQKTLTIFLAELVATDVQLILTEHQGYRWFDWNPPHDIQAKTINPLLATIERHWAGLNSSTSHGRES